MSTFFYRHPLAATLAFAAVLSFSVTQLRANTLYNNGGYDPRADAGYDIGAGNGVSDSFTVPTGTYNLTSATAYLSTYGGAAPTSVTWSVGTTPFGSQIGSGTAVGSQVSYTTLDLGTPGFVTYYVTTFDLSATAPVSHGTTYYLSLTSVAPNPSTWDWELSNGGTSASYTVISFPGLAPTFEGENSEAFSINGASGSAVPEPSRMIAFFGLGAMGLIGFVWRRRGAEV